MTNKPEVMQKLVMGVYPSFALLAGMQLDLFTPLAQGPQTATNLATALDVDGERLELLLYALAAAGLLTVEDGRFANTDEANVFLVRGSRHYMGSAHEIFSDIWGALLKTTESIRSGHPQAEHDFSAMSEEELGAFFRGLHAGALGHGREMAQRYDFSTYRSLLDVGGGSGGVSIALTEIHSYLHATVVDLPRVTPFTRRFVDEAGAGERVDVQTADAVAGPIVGEYDVAVARAFTQVLPRVAVQHALQTIGQAVQPGGHLYLITATLDDSRLSPADPVFFNLAFLNLYQGGQAYTESEYRTWLAEAGFILQERIPLPGIDSILWARRMSSIDSG